MSDDAEQALDPTKLTALLDDLEQENEQGRMGATVAIGAVRRAMSHGRLTK